MATKIIETIDLTCLFLNWKCKQSQVPGWIIYTIKCCQQDESMMSGENYKTSLNTLWIWTRVKIAAFLLTRQAQTHAGIHTHTHTHTHTHIYIYIIYMCVCVCVYWRVLIERNSLSVDDNIYIYIYIYIYIFVLPLHDFAVHLPIFVNSFSEILPVNWPNEYSVRQWSERPGFNPRSSHTKDTKNGTWWCPWLTLSIIRYVLRVKWSNPGNEVAPSPPPWCRSYWKVSLRVTLD